VRNWFQAFAFKWVNFHSYDTALTIKENIAIDEDSALKAASEIKKFDRERERQFSFDLI
jgi:hypothetical protein